MRWAWEQEVKPASAKLVLLCLSNCHNDDTGLCCPSIEFISERTGLNRKTVMPALISLRDQGLIDFNSRNRVARKYTLNTVARSPKSGTSVEVPKSDTRSPKSGHLKSQNRDTNHKQPIINKKTIPPEYIKTAEFMWGRIQAITNKKKPPNFETWGNHIRLLVERDGREPDLVAKVFLWANQHHFWQANILSPEKLRKQFDTLYAQMGREDNRGSHQQAPRKLTPAERVRENQRAAERRELAQRAPVVATVGEDDGNVRSHLGQPAGGHAQRHMDPGPFGHQQQAIGDWPEGVS